MKTGLAGPSLPTLVPSSGRVQAFDGSIDADTLRNIVERLPVGVTIAGPDGACLLANEAAARFGRCADPRRIETARSRVEVGARTFTVDTSIDVGPHRDIEDALFTRAYMDELTGLPNRSLIEQSAVDLMALAKPGERFALAFIDLDNFKHINDFYSHAAGDAVLVKVASRLSQLLGAADMLARIGGDEFVLLLGEIADEALLPAKLERLIERLKEPFFIDGYEMFISASVGVSLFPDHGTSYDGLRRSADSAMYRVKSGVKGGAMMFDESMRQAATGRMAIEQRFRLAIRDRRFCCAYQPKVDLRSQEVVGLEVLLRWRDEQGVIQAPGDFVGLAIELGLINEIAHLVLAEVVSSLDLIDATFGPHVTISLNVAAKQAEDVRFMEGFIDALARTGCPARFMIELTEEAFFTKSRFQRDVLPRIRAIGAKVSIDDFGAGYSSLSALADIEADEIKIDRAFVRDIYKRPRSQIVLRAIESLGRSLGMSIVAEGVETFEELVWLQASTNIHQAQGFHFSKPVLLDQIQRDRRDYLGRPEPVARQFAPTRHGTLRAG